MSVPINDSDKNVRSSARRKERLGDIEESMRLELAIADSIRETEHKIISDNTNINRRDNIIYQKPSGIISHTNYKISNAMARKMRFFSDSKELDEAYEIEDEQLNVGNLHITEIIDENFAIDNKNSSDQQDCKWFLIPYEIRQLIISYVGDPDILGILVQVSKTLFIPNEQIYKQICERIYLTQAYKKIFNLDKWVTWKNMMIYRPRIRMNGFYSIRMTYWKPPVNDAFWEEKRHEFIEVIIPIYSLINTDN